MIMAFIYSDSEALFIQLQIHAQRQHVNVGARQDCVVNPCEWLCWLMSLSKLSPQQKNPHHTFRPSIWNQCPSKKKVTLVPACYFLFDKTVFKIT
jgi:hypothetical protein